VKRESTEDEGSTKATGAADANTDPISKSSGAHPVGVGVGAAGGGAAGATVGSVAGPVGAAVGGAVGALAGGLAGKGLAEVVNPTVRRGPARKR
jgi:phage tail tape-measure protein